MKVSLARLVHTAGRASIHLLRGRWSEFIIKADRELHWGYLDFGKESNDQIGIDPAHGHRHHPSNYPVEYSLRRLGIVPTDAILDVGAGKGSAMIAMSFFPFRKIGGVELSPRLVDIAKRNLRRALLTRRTEVIHADAADFIGYDEYNYLYLFNPFPRHIVARVMSNLALSLARRPRQVVIIYNTPEFEDEVLGTGIFDIVDRWEPRQGFTPVAIYRSTITY